MDTNNREIKDQIKDPTKYNLKNWTATKGFSKCHWYDQWRDNVWHRLILRLYIWKHNADGFVFVLVLVYVVISYVPLFAYLYLGQEIHINHVQQTSTCSMIISFLVPQFDWCWMNLEGMFPSSLIFVLSLISK